jgi:glycosyltransferase involved in cell wall biosynthesis
LRICWYQDIDPFIYLGGAQQTDLTIIREGVKRGHDIQIVVPQTFRLEKNADLNIISNCALFTQQQLSQVAKAPTPYVFFSHDYVPLCKYRLFYPMLEKCSRCVNKTFAKEFLEKSNLIVWMSPLHREAWLRSIPELADHPYALTPSCLDVEKLSPTQMNPTPNTVIGVNCLLSFKGKNNVLSYARENPEFQFTFVGQSEVAPSDLPKNTKYVGQVSEEELIGLYAQHEYFIHLPSTCQPSERTCIEAALMGLKLIVNPLVGITSYPDFYKNGEVNREWLRTFVKDAPKRFWDGMEKLE